MSSRISNSQFAFHLPTLSYVDASWEEPNLRSATRPARQRQGFGAWLAAGFAAVNAWRSHSIARSELGLMNDRELMDIGLNRGDLERVFEPDHNRDLLNRSAHA